ncbi:MAG: SRPBCC family protein [Acidobacteriota bacterium]
MPQIIIEIFIDAPPATCLGLVRDERVIAEGSFPSGNDIKSAAPHRTVELGQIVTFRGKHLGFRQILTVKVVELEHGRRFVDKMIEGRFRAFRHTHEFVDVGGKTLMRDILNWTSPFGILGRVADKTFIERHLRKFVIGRNLRLRAIAESVD